MTLNQFFIVYFCCLATMLICRCAPMMLMKGRELPENVQAALNLIPPAAFAALVANDLFSVGMFDSGLLGGLLPLIAALVVVLVARLTKSLIWCAIAGVVVYALLTMLI